jgi:hypothetical protein
VAAHTVFPQGLHTLVFTIVIGYGNFALDIQCTVGWVDFYFFFILNESQVEKCCIPCKSWKNSKKLLSVHRALTQSALMGHHYKRVKVFFLSQWGRLGTKRRRILYGIKKYKLSLAKNTLEKNY